MQSRHQYNLHDLVAVGSHPNYHHNALCNIPGASRYKHPCANVGSNFITTAPEVASILLGICIVASMQAQYVGDTCFPI